MLKIIRKYHTNNPFKLAEYEHIKVSYKDLDGLPKGLYFRHDTKAYIIIDNHLTPAERDIVMSHEVGHHFLKHVGDTLFISNMNDIQEYEANKFAFLLASHTCLRCEPIMMDGIEFEKYLKEKDVLNLLSFIIKNVGKSGVY